MAFFSLSLRITVLGHGILRLDSFYAPLAGMANSFRSSGRFIWPLYYVLLAASLFAVMRYLETRRALLVLSGVVLLQIIDGRHARIAAAFDDTTAAGLTDPTGR